MALWRIEPWNSPDQIEEILAIEEQSFTNPWTREMYLAELENHGISNCLLAKDEAGRVVGFCSYWRVMDELHINNLAVLPSHRREGAATALLDAIVREGRAAGAVRATLEVRRSNEPARLLYERFGFEVAGVRRGYYTKPVEDALILRLERLDQAESGDARSGP
jgi:[ribosomal protein S18]-alanine N-acetyltransferase